MAKHNRPRRGSMAFRPRKRSETQMPSVGAWPKVEDSRLLGFAGYKAGMTHILYVDDTKSHKKGKEVFTPVTIIETPPITVFGIRFYKNKNVVLDFLTENENVLKNLKFNKLLKEKKKQELPSEFDDISVLVFVDPKSVISIGKKKIEKMEIGLGGKDKESKLEYAKSILGKQLKANEIFKDGEIIDIVAITKGKGWQGVVKRFGVNLRNRKQTAKRRHGGPLGTMGMGFVAYTIPRAGQVGYHKRTEINKRIMKIGKQEEIDKIIPKGGFVNYGIINNDFIILKGSTAGPKKRLIRFRKSMRKRDAPMIAPNISYISQRSQQ
ncbi:50S ribosomal protein L3 [Candidatus Micrarchaeota archaeon]|nr:50S ribosomal protein L3 [Candidatus Micrarchaeota archaeon]